MKKRLRVKSKNPPVVSVCMKIYSRPIGLLEMEARCGEKSFCYSIPHPARNPLDEEMLRRIALPKLEEALLRLKRSIYE